MKHIGILVAVEIDAVLERYKDKMAEEKRGFFTIYTVQKASYTMHFISSEAGEIRAAAAVQMLCDCYKIEMLINFGVVGALTEELASKKTCLVANVVHYDFDTSAADNCEVGRYIDYPDIFIPTTKNLLEKAHSIFPDFPIVTIASGDKFIASPEKKAELHKTFKADICDMESAAIVIVCDMNNIPNLLIKTVADSFSGGAAEFRASFVESSKEALAAAEKIIAEQCG